MKIEDYNLNKSFIESIVNKIDSEISLDVNDKLLVEQRVPSIMKTDIKDEKNSYKIEIDSSLNEKKQLLAIYHEITHLFLIELKYCFFQKLENMFGNSESSYKNHSFLQGVFDDFDLQKKNEFEFECFVSIVIPLANMFQHILLVKILNELNLQESNDYFFEILKNNFGAQKEKLQKNTLPEFQFVVTGLQFNLFSDNNVVGMSDFTSRYPLLTREFNRIFTFDFKIFTKLETENFHKEYSLKVDEFCQILLNSCLLKNRKLFTKEKKH